MTVSSGTRAATARPPRLDPSIPKVRRQAEATGERDMRVRNMVLGALAAIAVTPALPAHAATASQTLIVGLKAADRNAPAGAEDLPGTGAVTVDVPRDRLADASRKL